MSTNTCVTGNNLVLHKALGIMEYFLVSGDIQFCFTYLASPILPINLNMYPNRHTFPKPISGSYQKRYVLALPLASSRALGTITNSVCGV